MRAAICARISTQDQRTLTIQPHTAPEFIGSMPDLGTCPCGHSGMDVGWTGRLHGAWSWNTIGAPSGRRRSPPPREDQPHDTDPTTKPFEECARGRAWAGAANAQGEKPAGQGTAVTPFVSRRMDEMTSREIELFLNAGGDLVLIPFGPVSGHGGRFLSGCTRIGPTP